MTHRRTWTLETLVAELTRLHRSGRLPTGTGATRRYPALYEAACRHAGSWERAMRLAGIDYVAPRRWSKADVLAEIRRRHARGQSLAATRVPNHLALAAHRRFGSWRTARRIALPSFGELRLEWTRRRIIDQLRALERVGLLTVTRLRKAGLDRIVAAAVVEFGSWRAAVTAATPRHVWPQKQWLTPLVLEAIQRRHAQGLPLSSHLVAQDDKSLLYAAKRRFASWPVACARAGVPVPTKEIWTPSVILSEIAGRLLTHPSPPVALFAKSMTNKATELFGSWHLAVTLAGGRPH